MLKSLLEDFKKAKGTVQGIHNITVYEEQKEWKVRDPGESNPGESRD